MKSRKRYWGFRVSPNSQHHRPAPQMPTTDLLPLPPPTRPPETKLCPIILLCNGFRSLCSSFQWGSALSTLGRISILQYKTLQQKFLCSIAENFVEHNAMLISYTFKTALHGYAGRPDRGLLSSPAARNLFCGSWCRWGKCLFDVTKIGHAGW